MDLVYTPLHVHTSRGSLLDSINTPKSLVERAKKLKIKALAITDHGSCANHLEFYKTCIDNNIKPILGMEGYITSDMTVKDKTSTYYHIILLAKNQVGYKNLLKITSLAHVKGFYRKPRIDLETVRKHSLGEGIIASSACIGGEIPQMILNECPENEIINKIDEYKNTFDEFYLEVQPTNRPRDDLQKNVNIEIERLASKTNTEMIATSDSHYTNKDDFELHNVFIQISTQRDNEVYSDCWLKSTEEMQKGLPYIKEENVHKALANTNSIAGKCNVELTIGDGQVPTSSIPDGMTLDDYFYKLVVEGCKKKGFSDFPAEKKKVYWDRIQTEYHVMKEKGFIHYFLLLKEILESAKEHGIITSPTARGSAASSLICYVLGITHVDPIKYNLIFERFLTIEKKGLPDVDSDIATKDKQNLVNMIKDMYGHNRVAQISAYGTLQSKSAIQSIGKVLGISYDITKKINKSVVDGQSIEESLKSSKDLQDFQLTYPKLFEYAIKLEGLERNTTTHAGGVVITPRDKTLSDFCSIQLSKEGEEITQYEMNNCEEIGLVKMDFLGLSTLDVIYEIYDLIKSTQGKEIEIRPEETSFDDEKTYKMLAKGYTKGVFQLGSVGITKACMRMKPKTFEELTNLISFYRPATMEALERYLQKKEGLLEYVPSNQVIDNVLGVTKGELAYQEQMMRLMKDMADFSDAEADRARKVSSKKKEDEFMKYMDKFKKQSLENGFTEDEVQSVYDMIKDSASYSFALAHGVSYAMLTYITAYLKCHYPTEFMCALMTNQRKKGALDSVTLNEYIKECEAIGVEVFLPDINKSELEFSIVGDKQIMFGLNMIKGCNSRSLNNLIENRPYTSLDQILGVSLAKDTIIPLIKTGAFDAFGERYDMLIQFLAKRYGEGMEKKKIPKTLSNKSCLELYDNGLIKKSDFPIFGKTFKKSEEEEKKENERKKKKCLEKLADHNKRVVWEEWKENVLNGDKTTWEYEHLSYVLSGDLFPNYKMIDYDSISDGQEVDVPCFISDIDKKKIKNGNHKGKEMAIVSLDTPYGEIRGICWSGSWEMLKYKITKGSRLFIIGKKDNDQIIVLGAMDYELYVKNYG